MYISNWRYQSTSITNGHKYLKSAPSDRTSDKYKSPWSRARQATDRLGIGWSIRDIYEVELKVGGETVADRKAIFRNIRKHLRDKRTLSLRDNPHQGKTNICVAAAKASTHFFTNDNYMTFKDWRFIHRARLGFFNKLNAYNKARATLIKNVEDGLKWKPCLMC